MGRMRTREEWRFASAESGERSVMITGVRWRLASCADNWD